MSKTTTGDVISIFVWGVLVVFVFVGLGLIMVKASDASDLRKREAGYCVAIGGEWITDGKCQVGDKVVVITGLDK